MSSFIMSLWGGEDTIPLNIKYVDMLEDIVKDSTPGEPGKSLDDMECRLFGARKKLLGPKLIRTLNGIAYPVLSWAKSWICGRYLVLSGNFLHSRMTYLLHASRF